jgi:hypothetical protein
MCVQGSGGWKGGSERGLQVGGPGWLGFLLTAVVHVRPLDRSFTEFDLPAHIRGEEMLRKVGGCWEGERCWRL